jgi:hypothetical protein
VNPADLAVVAMAVVALASIGRDFMVQMRIADRVRVVSPPKQKQDERDSAAQAPADKPLRSAS